MSRTSRTRTSRRPVERYSKSDMPTVGDVVADPDMDSDDTLVVVRTHDTRADDFPIDDLDGETVASYSANSPYPEETFVVEIAFLNALQESYIRENVESVAELRDYLEDGGFQVYPYPAARLGKTPDDAVIDNPDESATRSASRDTDDDDDSEGVTDADDLLAKAMGDY